MKYNLYSISTIICLIEFILLTSKTIYGLYKIGDLPKESTFKCFKRNLIKGLIISLVPILNTIYLFIYFSWLWQKHAFRHEEWKIREIRW